MSARKIKRRILRLMHARLHGKFIWLTDELLAWERVVPVGREFGSPDFERLMEEDLQRWRSENLTRR